ncbi:MAG TPA: hypothetical protein VHJ19_04030 [Gammaproteobacteria bacterium]|nr:hypothetical protein [Gammaproteobacteria bacterium]
MQALNIGRVAIGLKYGKHVLIDGHIAGTGIDQIVGALKALNVDVHTIGV